MASVYSVTTETEEALTTSVETVLQLRGSSAVKAKILQWSISFDGVSATGEPVRVRLLRQTTDGTGAAASEVPWDPDNPTANCTALNTFSAEPTAGDVIEEHLVHPQAGIIMQYPLGREPVLDNASTSRIGIDVLAPAAVNACATLVWEE
jgi:hemolysin activation/secretion protein